MVQAISPNCPAVATERSFDAGVVRVQSVELRNFKNVRSGHVDVQTDTDAAKGYSADVVGIYGQNGSGKTAVVEAFLLLKHLLLGRTLPAGAGRWANAGDGGRSFEVAYKLRITGLPAGDCSVWYTVTVGPAERGVKVTRESLEGRLDDSAAKTRRTVWFQQKTELDLTVLAPKRLLCAIRQGGKNEAIKLKLPT